MEALSFDLLGALLISITLAILTGYPIVEEDEAERPDPGPIQALLTFSWFPQRGPALSV